MINMSSTKYINCVVPILAVLAYGAVCISCGDGTLSPFTSTESGHDPPDDSETNDSDTDSTSDTHRFCELNSRYPCSCNTPFERCEDDRSDCIYFGDIDAEYGACLRRCQNSSECGEMPGMDSLDGYCLLRIPNLPKYCVVYCDFIEDLCPFGQACAQFQFDFGDTDYVCVPL